MAKEREQERQRESATQVMLAARRKHTHTHTLRSDAEYNTTAMFNPKTHARSNRKNIYDYFES